MTYEETVEWLFAQLPMYQRIGQSAYKANLNNSIALDEHFGFPHKRFKSVHVAGTNGKGSTSHMLASIFQEAGYKTGLYTSPHLKDYRERIKINGVFIDKEYVVDFVAQNQKILNELKPSFFEMSVALAFCYFADNNVDVAIIEVGMGGRLDSTNIVIPELAVITNIGWDHMQFLGDSLSKIASEKAGIIKKNIPVVIGEFHQETIDVFRNQAVTNNAQIHLAFDNYQIELSKPQNHQKSEIIINGHASGIRSPLMGKYQEKNIGTVLTAIDVLKSKFRISEKDVAQGIENVIHNTSLQGRWQIIKNQPLTILDTAHNSDGLKITIKQVQSLHQGRIHFVLGFVNDKDVENIIELFPVNACFYYCNFTSQRAMNAGEVNEMAMKKGRGGTTYDSVKLAMDAAWAAALECDVVYVGGSTFVVADAL